MAKGKIKFKIIDEINDFRKLKEDWIELYNNLENKEIFYEAIWIEEYIKYFKNNNFKPFVVVGEEKGKIVTIAPLYIEEKKFGIIKKRILKFIVDRTADYQCILIRKDYNQYSVLKKLFSRIFEEQNWDMISLNNISYREKQSILIGEIIERFSNEAICYKKVEKIAPYINLVEFEEKRNSKRYKEIERKERSIDINEKININIDSKWDKDIWYQLVDIHKNTWKDSILKNETYVQFYENLFYKLYECGKLEFSYATYDKKVISGLLGFKCCNKVYVYNLYNDESWKKLSMGVILIKKIINHYRDSYTLLDMLLGNEEYKFYSTDSVINICDYTIIRKKQILLRVVKKIKSCLCN